MSENETTGTIPQENVTTPVEPEEKFCDISVKKRKTGARMIWSGDHSELLVNTSLFPNENQARIATLRKVAGHLGLTQAMRMDTTSLLDTTRKYPEAIDSILRWQGLARIRESNPDILSDQPVIPQNQTLVQEFQWAVDEYVLTGEYPKQMSDAVRDGIRAIPQSNGQSVVDYIASGRYLKYDGSNFTSYLKPIIDKLQQADGQTGQSEKYEYRPSQPQDIAGSKEPIEESAIEARVSPFYGGPYRKQVCRYDPVAGRIVKEAGEKRTWDVGDDPDDESVLKTKKKYEGKIQAGKETVVALPYNALPVASTLSPLNVQFMRDDLGLVSIEPKTPEQESDIKTFSFDFVMAETPSSQLNVPPTEKDKTSVGGDLDPDTQTFIDELSTQAWMSDVEKAREITYYLHRKLRYPKDEAEVGQIDSLYLPSGLSLWTKIAETGIAHCYWANIFRDELCKRLKIASRIPIGTYVGSKDPRFEFTIVAAPGLTEHAWGEVWDPDKQVWEHHGMDATPPKAKDDSEKKKEESQPLDGDFDKPIVEQPELSPEEIQRLYNELSKEKEVSPPDQTPEQRGADQFKNETGVELRDWLKLESWISGVNNTVVPAESAINHKQSTIYDEWRALFDLLYKRREIPHRVYKGPVRQNEGDVLDDPVTAYIDVRSNDDDPSGYQKTYQKPKERIEASAFDDDFILDISGSMIGQPEEEQRKMVLSSEYNIRELNKRLNHSQNKNRMTTPLSVHSRVAVFGNWTDVVEDAQTVKGLVGLNSVLTAQHQSSKGLNESLKQYRDSLTPEILQNIRQGGFSKVLTICSDGDVTDKPGCISLIKELRAAGIIVQGIGFGGSAQDIRVICHDPSDPDAAVVIDDVSQATLVRHKLLMKHLSKL